MFNRSTVMCLALVFGVTHGATAQNVRQISATALPSTTLPSSTLQVPAPETQLIMIRSTLLALTQANSSNNYTVLNALGSPTFRNSNTPTRLAQVFESFRANNIDMAPLALVMPQATQPPRIENGRLRMVGLFPTQPLSVKYDLMYEPVAGLWRLYGLSVNLDRAIAPVASATQTRK
jgi:hypothetical protein